MRSGESILLGRVAAVLARTPSTTDHLMLTRWRVLAMCQYLLGAPNKGLEEACTVALETFVSHGASAATDAALARAGAIIKTLEGKRHGVLPLLSTQKRQEVADYLDALSGAPNPIERAIDGVPRIRDRFGTDSSVLALPGLRHRFDLVAGILNDASRSHERRLRAAAAILYVDEPNDVIPDSLGTIGMLDDDYALRVTLEALEGDRTNAHLHWSEKISSLWEDLPFLQGMHLQRGDRPIPVTWLDRLNSYVSYSHVFGSEQAPLLLLQPSVACSPLHAIVSLIGLLVLDAVTSSQSKAQTLRVGQTYELDGFTVRFEGTHSGPRAAGWLRLCLRDGFSYQPPVLASRMVPVPDRKLSSLRDFKLPPAGASTDPMQQFFAWDASIGPTSISSQLVLVISRQRAFDLLEDVQSNGVRLLDHGLVRFLGAVPGEVDVHGALVLIVPSLSTARILVDRGIRMQAVLVDGYERLHRGRQELPFLMNRPEAPPVIAWSATGYYPSAPPTWLPPHKRLEVSSDDLVGILELDDEGSGDTHRSLWEAATGATIQSRAIEAPAPERAVADAIEVYKKAIDAAEQLPEYWNYHLRTQAQILRILVGATPAEWSEIRRFATEWSASLDQKWSSLRPSAVNALSDLRAQEKRIHEAIAAIPAEVNSRAVGMCDFLDETAGEVQWSFVCDRPEQARIVASFIRNTGLKRVEPVLLRDLAVCNSCLIAGWSGSSFARRLWAHTPRVIIAIIDERDRVRWERAIKQQGQTGGESLLGAIGVAPGTYATGDLAPPPIDHADDGPDERGAEWDLEERTPCVFLWVTGSTEAKVLAPSSRVVVEDGENVRERMAAQLCPDDRVILGTGTTRWSPADEFTEAVVHAVEASHSELTGSAKDWRRALRQLQCEKRLSVTELRDRLAAAGVAREEQTLEGWLDLDRAAPIAPKGMRAELEAIWPIIGAYATCALEETVSACARLRSLRGAAGKALLQLWKGRSVDLGVDAVWLDELVERLRQEAHVYEIEAVTLGEVPLSMIGCGISPALAGRFETDRMQMQPASASGEDDEGS